MVYNDSFVPRTEGEKGMMSPEKRAYGEREFKGCTVTV
jgi:hypothetical protein